jgi:hypothetical protein
MEPILPAAAVVYSLVSASNMHLVGWMDIHLLLHRDAFIILPLLLHCESFFILFFM